MTVFISYRHTDRGTALEIDRHLRSSGIETYLDVLDTESQTSVNITEVITRNIARSTHMIAVISQDTASSWWVPFEIGEATISATRISSYRTGYSALPEYLKMWPQMARMSHLSLFIEEYRREKTVALNRRGVFDSATTGKDAAENFHKSLKGRITRGY
ncbi:MULTISPECIES: toll/interleukin-1 receptor domain-containing protein [Vibrio]|uniref:toll/interleukin-1 receptor domain-containing protein n=1 Tax=Vibrio TaxID=662 RepID=UPI000C834668|nr:toll/interleukin-1 receptor domain-containing protein [Vibrio tasmaniensis]PMO81450.1 molecular chaperone Tir [Vibrio tasmaniensis]